MHVRLILAVFAALLLVLIPSSSLAELKGVRLTKDQVLSACGSHYEESNGLGGCTIPCAGGMTCDFSCGGDRCSGRASMLIDPGTGKPNGAAIPAFLMAYGQAVTLCPIFGIPGGCKIPCDPVYICQIFCGGKSYCAVTQEHLSAIKPKKPTDFPTGSLSSFSGGATPSAPIIP